MRRLFLHPSSPLSGKEALRHALLAALALTGVLLLISGPSGAAPEPGRPAMADPGSPPMPYEYPGGAASPAYQRAARGWQRAMNASIDQLSTASDRQTARSFAVFRSQLGGILLAAVIATMVLTGIRSARACTPDPAPHGEHV